MANQKPQEKANRRPFYTEITNVKEDFISSAGVESSVPLPLVTIPAGTVLFRSMKIPNPAQGEDVRHFYRDYLGNPEGARDVCLSPIHNVFFYPFPHVAFGAHTIGTTFTMIQMVVLVHAVTVVCAVSPSDFVRGRGLRDDGTAPWQRCSNFSGRGVECHPRTLAERTALSYDNCLRPEYQQRSGTRGWMAIADRDSVNPVVMSEGKKRTVVDKNSPMSTYLRKLATSLPAEAAKALANTYKDQQGHAGFPEIALYPYYEHKGAKLIKRACPTNDMAMRIIEKEALADNLNYLPIAAFTKNGFIDMVSGEFNYKSLNPTENAFVAEGAQSVITDNVHGYMTKLQREGLQLPFYGLSKLTYDMRTGFYVLDKVVPANLKLSQAKGTPLYRSLLLSLATEKAERFALWYTLVFRNYFPEKFMTDYKINDESKVKRAMIFNRYAFLRPVFEELAIPLPQFYRDALRKSAELFQADSGKKPASKAVVAPAPVDAPAEPQEERTPEYAAVTPQGTPPGSPPAPGTPPGTPPKGGKRQTRKKLSSKKRTTRSASARQDFGKHLASLFTRVWKAHGKKN